MGSAVHDSIKDWTDHHDDEIFFHKNLPQHLDKELINESLDAAEHQHFVEKTAEIGYLTHCLFVAMQFVEHGSLFEYKFKAIPFPSDPTLLLEGSVDVYDPTTQYIYDLKTSASARGDRRQLLTYAVGLRELGVPVQGGGFLYPLLKRKKVVESPILLEEIDEHERNMVAAYQVIKQGYEPVATVGPKCGFCDYRGTVKCPATYKRSSDFDFGERTEGGFKVSFGGNG